MNSEILKRLEYSIARESNHELDLLNFIEKNTEESSGSGSGSGSGSIICANYDVLLKELMIIRESLEYLSSNKHSTNVVKVVLRYLARKL